MPKKALTLFFGLCAAIAVYAQEVTVFSQLGHPDGVNSVAFSSNGRHVLSGSYDGTTHIWDTSTNGEWVVITPEG